VQQCGIIPAARLPLARPSLLFLALEHQKHESKSYNGDDNHRRLLSQLGCALIRAKIQEIAICQNDNGQSNEPGKESVAGHGGSFSRSHQPMLAHPDAIALIQIKSSPPQGPDTKAGRILRRKD
jgi:hypothetical protein